MTLAGAKAALSRGAKFGDVFPLLRTAAEGDELREWFCRTPGLPAPAAPAPRELGYTGEECGQCGSMKVVRNGSCVLCRDCGTTSGCS